MRALLIGGGGFVGGHLAAELARAGVSCTIVDQQRIDTPINAVTTTSRDLIFRATKLLAGAEFIVCDASDMTALRRAILRTKPDLVYFLAALPVVSQAQLDFASAGDSMVRGLTNCLEALREAARPCRFVYVSSSMVYGDFDGDPVPEEARTLPVNLYGGLKLAGEVLTRAYLGHTDLQQVVVRPMGVYGPGDIHNRVVQTFCEAAVFGREVVALNPDATLIDFTAVEDLVSGLRLAGLSPNAPGETFNLAYGRARSLEELLRIVHSSAPLAKVRRMEENDPTRPRRGSLDISKARRLLGYAPRIDLETGVARYIEHLRGSAEEPPTLTRALAG